MAGLGVAASHKAATAEEKEKGNRI